MAESSLEDPFAGLPDKEEYAKSLQDLDLKTKALRSKQFN